jgi:hypothetical protein
MEDISKKSIVETIDTAKEYATKLEDLIKSVEVAKKQVSIYYLHGTSLVYCIKYCWENLNFYLNDIL